MHIFVEISRLCHLSSLPKYEPDVRIALLHISCLQFKLIMEALADDGRAVRCGDPHSNPWAQYGAAD